MLINLPGWRCLRFRLSMTRHVAPFEDAKVDHSRPATLSFWCLQWLLVYANGCNGPPWEVNNPTLSAMFRRWQNYRSNRCDVLPFLFFFSKFSHCWWLGFLFVRYVTELLSNWSEKKNSLHGAKSDIFLIKTHGAGWLGLRTARSRGGGSIKIQTIWFEVHGN